MQKRDKSPIIKVNLMKENIHGKTQTHNTRSSKASLNLVKALATRRSDMNSLWEPQEDAPPKQQSSRFDNYVQRHSSTRRSHLHTSRERERDFSDSPENTNTSGYQCIKHQNKTYQRKRNVELICCMPKCETHILCRECKYKIFQCRHEQTIKLNDFSEQPILIFLKRDTSQSDLISGLILQQMQLFNKVKFQAEQSKEMLQQYLEKLQEQLKIKSQSIIQEFSEKIDVLNKLSQIQLKQIRTDIDSLVQTSLVYKDDFENRLTDNQDFAETVQKFKTQSEDPYEQVMNQVNRLQQDLNQIPQLNSFIQEQKFDILQQVNYQKLII